MPYYAVCYAHVCRWEKAKSATQAAMLAFGIADSERMTVMEATFNPKYASQKKKKEFLEKIEARHKEKTGNTIK